MKKIFNKIASVALAFSMLLAIAATVNASPVTGNTLVYCELTINITDGTDGEYTGRIWITLTDIAGGNEYSYTLTMQNYLLETPIQDTLIANTTYTVEVRFEERGLGMFDTQTNALVDRFPATGSGYVANWELRFMSATPAAVPVTQPQEISSARDESYAEGYELWEAFINAVEHMDGDSAYDWFFMTYGRAHESTLSELYERFTDGSIEDWIEFSLFERFLWYETYIRALNHLHSGNYDMFFGSENNFRQRSLRSVLDSLPRYNAEGAEAYENLMMWQYRYITANSSVYNFLTGMSHRDSSPANSDFDPIAASNERAAEEERLIEQELLEIEEELIPLGAMPEQEGEPGIWDATFNRARSNWITFAIVFAVFVALIGVIVYRKRKEIKEVGED